MRCTTRRFPFAIRTCLLVCLVVPLAACSTLDFSYAPVSTPGSLSGASLHVGEVTNMLGYDTPYKVRSNVELARPVVDVIREALVSELTRGGCRVGVGGLEVTAEVSCFAWTKNDPTQVDVNLHNTEITFVVRRRASRAILYGKRFSYSPNEGRFSFSIFDSEAVLKHLQECVRMFVEDPALRAAITTPEAESAALARANESAGGNPAYGPETPSATGSPLPAFSNTEFGDYHALVIGNDDYLYITKLETAVADARAVARLLEQSYGFKVTALLNGTRQQIVSALSKYRKTLRPSDNLLVYYAGHGYLDSEVGEGYWFPVDARNEDPANWVSNSTITTRLRGIPARHIMIVSDSCYSGSLTRGLTVKLRGADQFASVLARRTRVVLTSGGLEPVEDGGGGTHSLFAKTLLEALSANTQVLDGNALFKAVKSGVMLGSDQEPTYGNIRKSGHEAGGDFLFVRKGTAGGSSDAGKAEREPAPR